MTQVFKTGDKVVIVEGGWGIHPRHVGKTVTIHSVVYSYGETRYTTEEELTEPGLSNVHVARKTTARGESFKLVPVVLSTADKIRAVNVQIKALQTEKDALVATLLQELES